MIETAAEAFDREDLYLAAASDMYRRRYPLPIDPTRDPLKFRQSRRVGDATTRAAVHALCDEIRLS